MTKRIAVPYKDVKLRIVGPYADFYAHRIQRLDIPVTLPNTTINELGNDKHAGIITDIPEVTATFQALDVAIPIKDYSGGFRKDTGKSPAGVDLRIIEYMNPEDRTIRPTYAFNLYAKIKYWKATVTFETVSTQAS